MYGSGMRNPLSGSPGPNRAVKSRLAGRSPWPWIILSAGELANLIAALDQRQSTSEAIVLGLVIAIAGLALDMQQTLREKSAHQGAVAHYLNLVTDHPDLLEQLTSVSRNAVSVLEADDYLMSDAYRRELSRIMNDFDVKIATLSAGNLVRQQGDNALMKRACAASMQIIRGITDTSDMRWWSTQTGMEFRDLNAEAIKRGAVVRRVFVEQVTGDMQSEIDVQLSLGVECYRIQRKDIEPSLLFNVTIFDDGFAHRDISNIEGETIEYLYTRDSTEVLRAQGLFERLRHLADRVTTPSALAAVPDLHADIVAPPS